MSDQWKLVYGLSNGAIFNDPTPFFKVTLFFDAECLRNGTRYRHSFNGILIRLEHALLKIVISNDLE